MEKSLELPAIQSLAPESMTHFEDEEIRHAFGLLDSAMAVLEGFEVFSDSWY